MTGMEVITVILATLLTICSPLIWWYLAIRRFQSLEKLPGPKPLPLIGNGHQLGKSAEELLANLLHFKRKYGGVFKLYIGGNVRVVFAKPHLLESILSSNVHINKSDQYKLLKDWLGDGLLTGGGAKWRSRRKMITPTFHFKILEQFLEVFNAQGNVFIEVLSENTDKVIDIMSFANLYTLDVICETSMGIKVNAQRSENLEYVQAATSYLSTSMVRFFSYWQRNDWLFYFSPQYKSHKKNLAILKEFTSSVIKKRREELRRRQLKVVQDEVGQKRKIALLDLLLESEDSNKLSNEDVREEIDTFMFAGHDTTGSAISYTLLCFAENPEVQERVYQEIIATTASDPESSITMAQIQDMRYLDIVMKEAQRYWPTSPFVERKLEEDSYIDGVKYPAGTDILLFLYGLHRDEEVYPDPERFDPERFLPENTARRHTYAFLPFSAGPRNCIGQKFAMLEMKTTIVKVIRKFKVLPVPNFKPIVGVTGVLKSLNGVQIQLQKR